MSGKGHIEFFFEEVNIPGFSKKKVREWIIKTIAEEGGTPGAITYVFCKDDYLLKLNLEFLDHDTLTDIITFDYGEDTGNISGDIFISVERVRENAAGLNLSFSEELNRVIIHGVLHLLGYKDKSPDDEMLMRQKENYYLTLQA
ncbi:MAG: rRNA maturation RNase YbeY [Bacteroides sp.]|nr:rRNA maturation RNase YbeY [Bacteroides sp.]